MAALRKVMNHILYVVAGGSFLVMVVLTCWQVLARYALGNPSTWSEEMVSYLFAWASLFGASLVTGERGHMNIPILVERMQPKSRLFFSVFGECIAFLFSAIILVYGGVKISSLAMGQMTSSLGVAVGVFYIVLPLCGILNMLYTILNIVDIYQSSKQGKGA